MPRAYHNLRPFVLAFVVLAIAGARDANADVSLALAPDYTIVAPGEEFSVEIVVPVEGDPLNGYDAVVGFDPERLELLLPTPRSAGERALFVDACAQRFLITSVEDDSSAVTVSHVLLCAGARVTGPGATYELRFRARSVIGQTHLELLPGTAVYDGGTVAGPLHTTGAAVWIGDPSSSPGAVSRDRLVAVPNPFNPLTELRFTFAGATVARVEVFDVAGRHVATVFDGRVEPGPFTTTWDGRDLRGRAVVSGVYLARLTASNGVREVARLVLVR